jgi:hypothetical protein
MDEIFNQIITTIEERPEDFELSRFTLSDCETNVEYWVANGFFSYGVHAPVEVKFSLIQKFRFGRALSKWQEAKFKEKFNDQYKRKV